MSYHHTAAPGTGKDRFHWLVHFVEQRHQAYLYRVGQSHTPPTDPTICTYRFTNLKRSLDRGTIEIIDWLKGMPRASLPFYVLVARIINKAEILREYEPALSRGYDEYRFLQLMNRRLERHQPIRSNAYMMTTHGAATPWPVFYASGVIANAWRQRYDWMWEGGLPEVTCAAYAERLSRMHGVGSFLAGQIVADLKLLSTALTHAADHETFCAPGPGSKRGVKHLDWVDERTWEDKVARVHAIVNATLTNMKARYRVDRQDAQNVLCEFDKYMRVQQGQPYRRRL